MKKIRKALCILLAAMMVVCLCPITTMAEESAVVDPVIVVQRATATTLNGL